LNERENRGSTDSIRGICWAIHDDVPVEDVGLIDKADLDASWWGGSNLLVFLFKSASALKI
jgi:hypothetical protein